MVPDEVQSTAGMIPEDTKKSCPSFVYLLLLTTKKQVSNRSQHSPKKKTFDILLHITWKGNAGISAEKKSICQKKPSTLA